MHGASWQVCQLPFFLSSPVSLFLGMSRDAGQKKIKDRMGVSRRHQRGGANSRLHWSAIVHCAPTAKAKQHRQVGADRLEPTGWSRYYGHAQFGSRRAGTTAPLNLELNFELT